jgi:ribulose-phosphate 3-epimerase
MACAIPRPGRGEPRGDAGAARPRIAAHILAADLACVGHEVAAAVRSGADLLHFDVMELGGAAGTAAPLACRALKRVTRAPLEVHLLVKPDERLIAAFAASGADRIAFHPEASDDVLRTAAAVRGHGCAVGIALAAGAPLDALELLRGQVDEVLVTGACRGDGGAAIGPGVLGWLRALRRRLGAPLRGVAIAVDGGVDPSNAAALVEAGAGALVVESARCGARDRAEAIAALRGVLGEPAAARGRRPDAASAVARRVVR